MAAVKKHIILKSLFYNDLVSPAMQTFINPALAGKYDAEHHAPMWTPRTRKLYIVRFLACLGL